MSIDITIGKPIANTQVYILDKYGNPTPIGVTGELCIAGDSVGAGYLNRPELTAEKFVDNPFGEGKMYKTGDLAYWREDGNIIYVGRNDFQVKIRGLRIELGEIENAISSVDGVSQAVVIVRKDENGRQLICAFYTEASHIELANIKAVLSDKLPKYMMPHIFTVLPEMPLTSSGKVNRKALPEVDLQSISNDVEYIKPEGEVEKQLAQIMERVLEYSPIGRNDSFFDLGGDSLKAIEFVSIAHNEGIYFKLQDVFDYPTLKELGECIANENQEHNTYNMADFDKIHELLSRKDLSAIPPKKSIGDILLAGATGFLGIHILAEFINNESGKVYCVVRGKNVSDAEERLKGLLRYYFDGKYIDLIGSRIVVLCGDTTKENLGIEKLPTVDMVINAAATVKHYGSYKYFYDVNVGGTMNAMNIAKSMNAKFVHVSTLSVSGNGMLDVFDGKVSEESKVFTESDLFINQELDNVYIRSKFEAELAVLNEVVNGGVKANIVRVGNLTNRSSDLKFQPNFESNAFLSRVKAVLEMGMLPDYMMNLYSEFSPIDDTAKAIIKIAQHFNDTNVEFHAYNSKHLYFDKFVEFSKKLNIDVTVLNGEEFTEKLQELGRDEKTQYIYEALINDMDKDGKLVYDSNIHIENEFTMEYLKKIGFEWTNIDFDYISRYVEYFKSIGYLNV